MSSYYTVKTQYLHATLDPRTLELHTLLFFLPCEANYTGCFNKTTSHLSLPLPYKDRWDIEVLLPTSNAALHQLHAHFPSHPPNKTPFPSMHTHPKSLVSTNFWKQQILPLYTKRALKKRMKQLLSPTLLLLILFLLCTTTYGQSLAPAAAPSGATTTSGQSSPPTS